MGFIDKTQLQTLGLSMPNSDYGAYLLHLAGEGR
jgi:hypothetical protein